MQPLLEIAVNSARYEFTRNDPYDRSASVELVVPPMISSGEYMRSIREFRVPAGAVVVWYLGQNGFLLKDAAGPLIGIDLYLSNNCATKFAHLPFRLDRQLPIFIQPEDLDVDLFLTTHSHEDHADPETIRRMQRREETVFAGPLNAVGIYDTCGVPEKSCRLLHPGETMDVGGTAVQATFAIPTDATDLNHCGLLLSFGNGITFYNTGDTAWAERLPSLLPRNVDVCAICMNGGFHNLSATQAARIVTEIDPAVVIPCHYDMMINNVGNPEMLRVALDLLGSRSTFYMMRYYEPWLYARADHSADITVREEER